MWTRNAGRATVRVPLGCAGVVGTRGLVSSPVIVMDADVQVSRQARTRRAAHARRITALSVKRPMRHWSCRQVVSTTVHNVIPASLSREVAHSPTRHARPLRVPERQRRHTSARPTPSPRAHCFATHCCPARADAQLCFSSASKISSDSSSSFWREGRHHRRNGIALRTRAPHAPQGRLARRTRTASAARTYAWVARSSHTRPWVAAVPTDQRKKARGSEKRSAVVRWLSALEASRNGTCDVCQGGKRRDRNISSGYRAERGETRTYSVVR